MKAIDGFVLTVSPLSGTVYMAKLTKTPHLMSDNRRVVPEPELYQAIIGHVDAKLKKGNDTLTITADGKPVAEIKIFRDNF